MHNDGISMCISSRDGLGAILKIAFITFI
jgi:hypothetical protein